MPPLEGLLEAIRDERGLCDHHEPATSVANIENLETRLRMLTAGVLLDVFPSEENWKQLAELEGHWLLDPRDVAYRSVKEIEPAFRSLGIGGPRHHMRAWWHVARGIQGRFKGSTRDLLTSNNDDAVQIVAYLQESKTTFPILSGPVVSARWLDLVHRVAGISLSNWSDLSVEVPSSLQSIAQEEFDLALRDAHPQMASALQTWDRKCSRLGLDQCGLVDCPRRN